MVLQIACTRSEVHSYNCGAGGRVWRLAESAMDFNGALLSKRSLGAGPRGC
jgi:hypothetical protein